jgi:hypothetical protein
MGAQIGIEAPIELMVESSNGRRARFPFRGCERKAGKRKADEYNDCFLGTEVDGLLSLFG